MPKLDSTPEKLRPYLFHGVDLSWREGDKQALAECPHCGKEGKFSVEIATGRYRCFVCGFGTERGAGNIYTFIRWLWEGAHTGAGGPSSDFAQLSRDRRLNYIPLTARSWGIVYLSGHAYIPGYGPKGEMNQLYRYTEIDGKHRLLPTPTLGHQLHAPIGTLPKLKETVYITEGPWDGMALHEALSVAKQAGNGYIATSNVGASLLDTSSIIAVPGCQTFLDHWIPLLANRHVCLLYDSDHPNERNREPVGYTAMRRVAKLLHSSKNPPASIRYLNWGPAGYDPALISGWDVRDALTLDPFDSDSLITGLKSRVAALGSLLARITDPPREWRITQRRSFNANGGKSGNPSTSGNLSTNSTPATAAGDSSSNQSDRSQPQLSSNGDGAEPESSAKLEPIYCTDYKTVSNAWKAALSMTDNLECTLSVILAASVSTPFLGEQLWIKIIGPPSSGKTTLVEGLAVAREITVSKDTIRGFHDGWKDPKGENEGEDLSLAGMCDGKTLITKDGDTLLKSPNMPQILSEGRALYDGASRYHYRNHKIGEHTGHRMTWILCGTSALREIDDSELGARQLDCVVMDAIDDQFEDDVGLRAAYQECRNMKLLSDGKPESQYPEELAEAMALTGGYAEYLRNNAEQLSKETDMQDDHIRECNRLGKFIAYMRARPPKRKEDIDEKATREFSARLVKQLIRLAVNLSIVLNEPKSNERVMERVRKVAKDTARGYVLEIVTHLANVGENGSSSKSIGLAANRGEEKVWKILRFLRHLEVVKQFKSEKDGSVRWKLTTNIEKLYKEVYQRA